ncbi:clasp N terminal-domain-containing protein [Immersiella caudata]|uniref:Clasp N terminal-domain-containing protein n=1 Tax=Immersiella caudata TaxID=314043 RepID=A0AA40C6S2_9PEZI|nr:clasp N terminal-domain-containing protein [Immersiella caudata]
MADKMTEKQVADLQTALRSDTSTDSKVNQVNAIKSSIKQHNVPEACVAPLFDALRAASSSQHAVLVNAGFTALNHLLTRLSRQEPKYLAKEAARTLPLIIEKLGDQKEKFRSIALQALVTLYAAAPLDVERSVRNTAMVGKNPRAKEASLQWLLQMHQENGLQFRSYVPTLMELLEDADGMVRDAAKSTVIELFRNAPNAAKSDLKRQLKNFKVRSAIEQAIVKELIPTSVSSSAATSQVPDEPTPPTRSLAASVTSQSSERPITPMPETRPEQVDPMYVNTQRELDEIFREMHFHFEGRETEQNWLKREESIIKLRKLMAGNAASDFHESFLSGLRALLDGILKAVNSLRTSLSKEGCSLIQDTARVYGPGMDPMVELLMQNFIKLSAATKKIASQQANITVDAILGRVTYNARLMQHVWGACQDKNVQPRLYATGWLKTLLNKEAHHKSHVEHSGGLDVVEKCIKKGLADPNPGVREKMRSTYWTFAGIWPARAEMIMNGLDGTAQKLLQNDPNNPNSPKKDEVKARPGLGLSKSTMGSTKPSLRETMLAQKKAAMASKNMPTRPGSAMAHFSPTRAVSNASQTSVASSAATTSTTSTVRTRPELTVGGISGAPMRPSRRRPEVAARPATAGPYSVRSHDGPSTEQSSPGETHKTKAITPRSIAASPKRTAPRTRPGHAATASEGSIPTPSKVAAVKATASPRTTPSGAPTPSSKPRFVVPRTSSPPRALEDLTMVMPSILKPRESVSQAARLSPVPPSPAPSSQAPPSPAPSASPPVAEAVLAVTGPVVPVPVEAETPTRPLRVYEDPFTEDQTTPKPTFAVPVLEDKPVNEDAASLQRPAGENGIPDVSISSPEKAKQNMRLLDSGIAKVKAKSLDVHGFRKIQGIIRESKTNFPDDKFDTLLSGLFEYLESPLVQVPPEKVQDVKAQILATIKLMLKKMRDNFQPHVSRGLESLLRARAGYDGRTHIVSGLELLSDELVTLGDASEITVVLSRMLGSMDGDATSSRSLSMGLHVLKEMVELRKDFMPSTAELDTLASLAGRCLESLESAVRMDAVQLCVALHERVGDARFWEALKGVRDDPKSLITYYVVKRQREKEGTNGSAAAASVPAAMVLG